MIQYSNEIHNLIEKETSKWKKSDLESKLLQYDIPCGKVNSIHEAIEEPQIKHRNSIKTFISNKNQIKIMGPGFQINGKSQNIESPPPVLGQHTSEILYSLGRTQDQINQLIADGIVLDNFHQNKNQ